MLQGFDLCLIVQETSSYFSSNRSPCRIRLSVEQGYEIGQG